MLSKVGIFRRERINKFSLKKKKMKSNQVEFNSGIRTHNSGRKPILFQLLQNGLTLRSTQKIEMKGNKGNRKIPRLYFYRYFLSILIRIFFRHSVYLGFFCRKKLFCKNRRETNKKPIKQKSIIALNHLVNFAWSTFPNWPIKRKKLHFARRIPGLWGP